MSNNNKPLASIIVPLLRQVDKWLKQSVLSALNQTVQTEVIVVTSPHTPQSNLEVLEQFGNEYSNLVVRERDIGKKFPGALNNGISTSKSDRIGFLLSDDWINPDAIERCLAYDTDIVSTGQCHYMADGSTRIHNLDIQHNMREFNSLPTNHLKTTYLTYFFLFKKEALLKVGGVDETLDVVYGIDDFDLIWTLLENDASVSIENEILYNVRDHEGERLTNMKFNDILLEFERILDKHKIVGEEKDNIIRWHSQWWGKPVHK